MHNIHTQIKELLKTDYDIEELQNIANTVNLHIMNKQLENKGKIVKILNVPEKCERFYLHEVAPNVFIKAYDIQYPLECHSHRGFWCYCANDSRYYISINNLAICGYTTRILSENMIPIKFTEYDNKKEKNSIPANFYQPPEIYGGNDIRNITEKLRYVPKSVHTDRKYIIRVGDKDNLREDLSLCSDKELRLVKDIASHWLMVGFLAENENASKNKYIKNEFII